MPLPIPKKPRIKRQPSVVNPKHTAVADAILEGSSVRDAVEAAGYTCQNNDANIMRLKGVKEALAASREEMEEVSTLKKIDVMSLIVEAIDMARTLADPANMINGADKLAKMMGYYAPETKRIELTADQSVFHSKLRALSDAELMDIASGRSRVIEGETIQ